MKLTVLVDNNTYIDQYYLGEPALSLYIEDGPARVLFDAGYSDAFVRNAEKLGVDLRGLTHIVLSHGHDDHTRGLPALFALGDYRKVPLIAHPDCFLPKRMGTLDFGCPYRETEIRSLCDFRPSTAPLAITERLLFLGEIPRALAIEPSYTIGECQRDGVWQDDGVAEDSALVYKSADGLFIITGCSHSGICNIIAYAKTLFPDRPVLGVIGGFHLFHCDQRLQDTISYFQAQNLQHLYPCHCVSFQAKAEMHRVIPVQETGVGLQLNW